jgi:hypothetical protein
MGVTVIKMINNMIPAPGTVVVRNSERRRTSPFGETVEFSRSEARTIDWGIPWAWTVDHYRDGHYISVSIEIGSTRRYFSFWQQDDDIWVTESGGFSGTRMRLGDIDGDRRLVILPDRILLLKMTDPLPPPPRVIPTLACEFIGPPYDLMSTDHRDRLTVSNDSVLGGFTGGFTIENEARFALTYGVSAGFQRTVNFASPGSVRVQGSWDISADKLWAFGLGYADANIVLRLEVLPVRAIGQSEPAFVTEASYGHLRSVLIIPSQIGTLPSSTRPVLTLDFAPTRMNDAYVLKAIVTSWATAAGWCQANASCFGRFLGWEMCRI